MKLSNLFQLMEGREDVLFAKYEQKIEQQLAHNGEKIETRRAFDELFRAVGPKVADWAIRQYLKGQFRIEDAGRVNDDVQQYQKLSRRLPVEERDINKFDYRYIVNKLDDLNKPEISTDAPDEDGVKVMYKGPYGFLCEILTKEAAMRLGKGTKWCTAAEKDNRFEEYARDGQLFMFQNTRGHKFQFQFEAKQFMDRRNEPMTVQEINEMVEAVPVIEKLFFVKLVEMFQHSRNPIPETWDELDSSDGLAKVIQRAVDVESTHLHVPHLDQLKYTLPFLRVDRVRTYEYLHDDDKFIIELFKMSNDQQYNVLKDLERDSDLRKRVINGLTYKVDGKSTYLENFTVAGAGNRFYGNILKIQSPSFLRDIVNLRVTSNTSGDVRTSPDSLLRKALNAKQHAQIHLTPDEFEYGLQIVKALQGDGNIASIGVSIAHRSDLNLELINDKSKELLLNTCDPKIKSLLNERFMGTSVDSHSFGRILKEAKNGKLPSTGLVMMCHLAQIDDVEIEQFTREYIRDLNTPTSGEIELLYPTLIVETVEAIFRTALNEESVVPPYGSWLIESKAAAFSELLNLTLLQSVFDVTPKFEHLVQTKAITVDATVNELKQRCIENNLAWYLETSSWSSFVDSLHDAEGEE